MHLTAPIATNASLRLRQDASETEQDHTARPTTLERLPFIDSLRGLAAIYVLLFHQAFVVFPVRATPPWLSDLLFNGRAGVTLFFIVSAFSLCFAQPDTFAQPGSVRAFYIRRAARILPLFYAMLAFTVLKDWATGGWPHSPWQITCSAGLFFNLLPGEEGGIVPGSWTIGVEVVFYAIFPLLFPRLRSLSAVCATTVAALLVALAFHAVMRGTSYSVEVQKSFYGVGFLRHLPVFLTGMATWMIWSRYIRYRHVPAAYGWILILISLAAYEATVLGILNLPFPDPYYWEAVSFAGLLLGLAICPAAILVNNATLFLGRISYSLYLLHPTVMFALRPLYEAIKRWHLAPNATFLVSLFLSGLCIVPLAAASYYMIERPGMRLGNRMIKRHQRVAGR
jgi:peptidoglycan/LPS O-acetylase OafA/YrhL